MNTWQPINTAPKDGTVILGREHGDDAVFPMRWETGSWRGHGWRLVYVVWGDESNHCDPTHWAPIPKWTE